MPAPASRSLRTRALFAWAALVAAGGVVAVVAGPPSSATQVATDAETDDTERTRPVLPPTTRNTTSTTGAAPTTVAADPSTTAAAPTVPSTAAPEETEPAPVETVPSTDPAPPPIEVPLAPAAGRYPAAISGRASVFGQNQNVPATGNMVVEQVDGSTQRLTVPGGLGSLTLVVRYLPDGADLVSLDLSAGGITKSFGPGAGARLFDFTAPPVSSWSWSVTSTDGKTTVQHTATVTGTGTSNIGGVSVPVRIVESVLQASGDVQGTVRFVSSLAPDHRLLVGQQQVIDLRASLNGLSVPVVANTTMALQRLTPS